MPNIAGNLLINRMRITVPQATRPQEGPPIPGLLDVDTGLQQCLRAFPVNEPTDDPALGAASRVMVFPMSPIANWPSIIHGEPYMDATTKTVHVTFVNFNPAPETLNVLFWNPHSIVCPLSANTYGLFS
jgi:hypothetical protein